MKASLTLGHLNQIWSFRGSEEDAVASLQAQGREKRAQKVLATSLHATAVDASLVEGMVGAGTRDCSRQTQGDLVWTQRQSQGPQEWARPPECDQAQWTDLSLHVRREWARPQSSFIRSSLTEGAAPPRQALGTHKHVWVAHTQGGAETWTDSRWVRDFHRRFTPLAASWAQHRKDLRAHFRVLCWGGQRAASATVCFVSTHQGDREYHRGHVPVDRSGGRTPTGSFTSKSAPALPTSRGSFEPDPRASTPTPGERPALDRAMTTARQRGDPSNTQCSL